MKTIGCSCHPLPINDPENLTAPGVKSRNAIVCASKLGITSAIEFLHSQNDQLIKTPDLDGNTAFTLACEYADLRTVKFLHEV